MMMQDGGAILTAARLMGQAIEKGDDTEELRLRLHLQSLALSVLHLVNDTEEWKSGTAPTATGGSPRRDAPGQTDT